MVSMGYPTREEQRAYSRKHYQENRDVYLARQAERRRRHREIVDEAKSGPCVDCGLRYPPWVMDFDHVRGEKFMNVSRLNSFPSEKRIRDEIAKCDLVCSNCHRQRTHDRAQGE